MTADPAAPARIDPTWAFGTAAVSLALALVGSHLIATDAGPYPLAKIATFLAAIALPGWAAVGVILATIPREGLWPSPRPRALTILAAIVLALLDLAAIGLLLFAASRTVGIGFGVACLLALAFLDRVTAARAG